MVAECSTGEKSAGAGEKKVKNGRDLLVPTNSWELFHANERNEEDRSDDLRHDSKRFPIHLHGRLLQRSGFLLRTFLHRRAWTRPFTVSLPSVKFPALE